MAVRANVAYVDPVGACVGINGARVKAIVNELGNEQIDIIEWDSNSAQLIVNALSPAKVVSAVADDEEKKAKIDVWGVGTKLITAYDQPALGAVYKIVSMEDDKGVMHDTIKLSNNAEKVSTPGKKQVWRITSRAKGKSEGDYITFADTDVNALEEINMFHPTYTYINKTVRDFDAVPLLVPIYDQGLLIYDLPSLDEIKAYATKELDELWNEYKRVLIFQDYPVDPAKDVWDNKMTLIDNVRKKAHDLSE